MVSVANVEDVDDHQSDDETTPCCRHWWLETMRRGRDKVNNDFLANIMGDKFKTGPLNDLGGRDFRVALNCSNACGVGDMTVVVR